MSVSTDFEDDEFAANPLDLAERFVSLNGWTFERRNDEEMAVDIPGQWSDYSLYLSWSKEREIMYFTCVFDLKVSEKRRPVLFELLSITNERLWLGHFGFWVEENLPIFRYSMMLQGIEPETCLERIEDVVDVALSECDRFYPTFQFGLHEGHSASEALAASLLDTVGEA